MQKSGGKTSAAGAARLLNANPVTLAIGEGRLFDARGFALFSAVLSSDSSGGTLTVTRAPGATSTAVSTGSMGVISLAGASSGGSTSIDIDWPYYYASYANSTGSTGNSALLALT